MSRLYIDLSTKLFASRSTSSTTLLSVFVDFYGFESAILSGLSFGLNRRYSGVALIGEVSIVVELVGTNP